MKARKKSFNYKRLIIVLAIILLAVLIFFSYRSLKVKTIYVIGNNIINESEILDNTDLLTYPNLYQVSEKDIKAQLQENKLINNVRVKKSLSGKVIIEITEHKVLYQDKNGKYML